jgi:Ca2+-binding EF-hand superfamily protein
MELSIGASADDAAKPEAAVTSDVQTQANPQVKTDVPARNILQDADANHDGKVTLDEFKAFRPDATEEHFKKRDRNGDGVLTKDDFVDERGEFLGPVLKNADANRDGIVTPEEYANAYPKAPEDGFAKLDFNKDGVLSMGDKSDQKRISLTEIIQKADKDGDEKVTIEEMKASNMTISQEGFDRFDRNKDGFLTKDDVSSRKGETSEQYNRPHAKLITDADVNKDGKTTFEELKAVLPKMTEERFKRLDKNGDGALSSADNSTEEIVQPVNNPDAPHFRQKIVGADANHDGKVTYEEAKELFPNMTQEGFNKRDTNGDGVLTSDDKD